MILTGLKVCFFNRHRRTSALIFFTAWNWGVAIAVGTMWETCEVPDIPMYSHEK